MTEDCIFCKIIKGEIPSTKIYEDDKVLAFLDINPISQGHTVVIPKLHAKNLFDFPDESFDYFFKRLKEIAVMIKKNLKADGMNILQNNERAAGQVVDHIHFHIIPRWHGDGLFKSVFKKKIDITTEELKTTAKRIKS